MVQAKHLRHPLHPTLQRFASGALVVFALLCAPTRARAGVFPTPTPGFPVAVGAGANYLGPPVFADLDGDFENEIIFGGNDGRVYAYRGNGLLLWQYDTGDTGIGGKPAVADIDGDGFPEVVVGAGSTLQVGTTPGVTVLSHTGGFQCHFATGAGVFSSPALADLDFDDGGLKEIVFGSWDFKVRVINHDCSLKNQVMLSDTPWSSPAIGDLDRDGIPEIVIGAPANPVAGPVGDGGLIHAFRNNLASEMPGFPYFIDETVDSSPALGDINGDGWLDIVVGAGWCWDRPICAPEGATHLVTEAVYALDRFGALLPGWPVVLPADRYVFGSPALADFDGDFDLEVVFNTLQKVEPPTTPEGWVYALGGNGAILAGWPKRPQTPATCDTSSFFGTSASPVVADLDGVGGLEIALPSVWETVVWSTAGVQLTRTDACPDPPSQWALVTGGPVQSIGIGDIDGDGAAELVAAGIDASPLTGLLSSWSFGAAAIGARQPWPQFRRSADNHAILRFELLRDGFESGDFAEWSSSSP
ncbi:MAG: VCBS repeat-containing protein [Thermoanaerobaculia bacterium]|nr:VCBS repeat-containing protein [Thermoanaerobaculia bacterium]MBP9825196.1 VCBS repeat-containing protein [Thermoanaerobaculia bacterium]